MIRHQLILSCFSRLNSERRFVVFLDFIRANLERADKPSLEEGASCDT